MKAPANVFLHEYCGCGGRIYRHWTIRRACGEGCEGDLLCAEVEDRCADCERVHAASKHAKMPCGELGELFDKWNASEITREQFDEAVARTVRRVGGVWNAQAS